MARIRSKSIRATSFYRRIQLYNKIKVLYYSDFYESQVFEIAESSGGRNSEQRNVE